MNSSFLQSTLFSQHQNLLHGFTTRELGDDYEKIALQLKVPQSSILTLQQIHSNRVIIVTDDIKRAGRNTIEGDALITNEPGLMIGIRTADCVPCLLYDPVNRVIASVHIGWRGLVGGIIQNTIAELTKNYKTDVSQLVMALGPAICGKCFEIGPDVAQIFRDQFGDKVELIKGQTDRYYVDLRQGCNLTLADLGVESSKIDCLTYCTSCQPDLLYSYRRGDKEARSLGFVGLKDYWRRQ